MGFYLTIKESHNNYKDVLEDLYRRGLKESLLFIADGITDLDEELLFRLKNMKIGRIQKIVEMLK